MQNLSRWLCIYLWLGWNSQLVALPIGFGTTPAAQDYEEIKSSNFYLYHNKGADKEARGLINALEHAKPALDLWFGKSRSSPLPVVVSASTANASFANFITDAIELQTLGRGDRDLAWHEFVHETMYRHFKNWLGPAGSVLHLLWLPSWYVEGLAEALSVSIGSDQQSGVERYHALSGKWPSYARLHSLYSDASFSFRGYALAGSFMAYLLRRDKNHELGTFLNDYFHKSMPWHWPAALLPLKNTMPLDAILMRHFKKNGEQLYAEYQKEASKFWRSQTTLQAISTKNKRGLKVDRASQWLQTYKGKDVKVYYLERDDDRAVHFYTLEKHKDALRIANKELRAEVPESRSWSQSEDESWLRIEQHKTLSGEPIFRIVDSHDKILAEYPGYGTNLQRYAQGMSWLEHHLDSTRFCIGENTNEALRNKTCVLTVRQPESLQIAGYSLTDDRVWLTRSLQTLYGDRFAVVEVRLVGKTQRTLIENQIAKPINILQTATDKLWMLVAQRNHRSMLQYDSSMSQCLAQVDLADHVHEISYSPGPLSETNFLALTYAGETNALTEIDTSQLTKGSCTKLSGHDSPLLAAMRTKRSGGTIATLANALTSSGLWQHAQTTESIAMVDGAASLLDQAPPESVTINNKSTPASTRIRPVVAVPWLGADSDGMQYALLSVPLMDHMQNEELRLYLGYGLASRFPHTEISLSSTRFWPTIKFDVFRYQTWNGRYRNPKAKDSDPESELYNYAYLDERGARLSTSTLLQSVNIRFDLGLKSSYLRNYRGAPWTKEGNLNEAFAGVAKLTKIGGLDWNKSVDVRVAPAGINPIFDYNTVAASTDLSYNWSWRNAFALTQLSGSRTRGKSKRELQEVYRPMQVYVPGSGDALNNLNTPLIGSGALFKAHYGNTQARAGLTYGLDIVERMDKLIRLVYWDSLQATAFLNYGGAWQDAAFDDDNLIAAHGYNLAAKFDIKGVNIALGGGFGQVFGNNIEAYTSLSFDAIF